MLAVLLRHFVAITLGLLLGTLLASPARAVAAPSLHEASASVAEAMGYERASYSYDGSCSLSIAHMDQLEGRVQPRRGSEPAAPVGSAPVRDFVVAAETGPRFFRGARGADSPSFSPRPNEFKVDPETGLVHDTHGVSVFDNPESVSSKGFTPHEINQSTIPDELRIIQRGQDPHHYEIVPQPGANLTPEQFGACLSRIEC